MHVRRGFLSWGVFLILAGAVPLAARAGYLTDDQLGRLWSLWPLILVGVGVGLILGRTRFGFLGGLLVAATLGLMVGGLLSSGIVGFTASACGGGTGDVAFPTRDGTLAAPSATVDVQLDCGNLTLGAGDGDAWSVEGQDGTGTGPDIQADDTSLSVRSRTTDHGLFGILGDRQSWRVTVPAATRLDLDLAANAGSAAIDLEGATLGSVHLQLNAGSSTVDLGSVREIGSVRFQLNAGSLGVTLPDVSMTGSIEANAGSVDLCAPEGVALQLHTGQNFVASYDYGGHGLVHDGMTWTTPGFDTASVRIELTTTANAGSFTLDPAGGCD
jgi:hypothetical protein